jgi:hypothetical protein
MYSCPPMRGRRECRALDAPAASRAKIESTRVSHHGSDAGTARHSPRNGFTACFVISPVIGFVATAGVMRSIIARCRRRGIRTTRLRRPLPLSSSVTPQRPSRPAPNVRDDRETPLLRGTGYESAYSCFYPAVKSISENQKLQIAGPRHCRIARRNVIHLSQPLGRASAFAGACSSMVRAGRS